MSIDFNNARGPILTRDRDRALITDNMDSAEQVRASELFDAMEQIVTRADTEGRSLYRSESDRFDKLEGEFNEIVNRAAAAQQFVDNARESQRQAAAREQAVADREAARAARPGALSLAQSTANYNAGESSRFSVSSRGVYGPDSQYSYIRDLIALRTGIYGPEVSQRLAANREEIERSGDPMIQETLNRAVSTGAGVGGEFVPPLWMVNDFVNAARPHRITANLVDHETLPSGTDSINIPRIVTGTSVQLQAGEGTAIANVSPTTGSISTPVTTLAGSITASIQSVALGPLGDKWIMDDLSRAYSQATNGAVLDQTAGTGAWAGLLNQSGTLSQVSTATDAKGAYSALAGAVNQIATSTFEYPDVCIMHPRRWAWLQAQADSTGRPLFVGVNSAPGDQAMNAFGTGNQMAGMSGHVGYLNNGLAVFADPMVPTNLGTGTDEDPILVLRSKDAVLLESAPMLGAFQETYASTLSWLFRVYAFQAFALRRSESLCVVTNTNWTAPTF